MLAPLASAISLTAQTILILLASCLLLGSLLWRSFNKRPAKTSLSLSTQTDGDVRAVVAKSPIFVAHDDPALTKKLAPGAQLSKKQQDALPQGVQAKFKLMNLFKDGKGNSFQDALPQGLQTKLMDLFKDGKGNTFIAETPGLLQQYQPTNESAVRVNQYFGNILVINLDIHEKRLQQISANLEKQGLHWRRIRATHGSEELIDRNDAQDKGLVHVHLHPSKNIKMRSNGESMYSPGAMGCSVSHIKALQVAAVSDRPTIILEDDLLLRGDAFREQLASLIDYIEDYQFDWLFLGPLRVSPDPNLRKSLRLKMSTAKKQKPIAPTPR